MGQYFLIVNLDKQEYINPHKAGHGAKLWEIAVNNISSIFAFLLRQSSESGGGDIQFNSKYCGSWAGNRIIVIGDYDDSGLYNHAQQNFKEISQDIREDLNKFVEEEVIKNEFE